MVLCQSWEGGGVTKFVGDGVSRSGVITGAGVIMGDGVMTFEGIGVGAVGKGVMAGFIVVGDVVGKEVGGYV